MRHFVCVLISFCFAADANLRQNVEERSTAPDSDADDEPKKAEDFFRRGKGDYVMKSLKFFNTKKGRWGWAKNPGREIPLLMTLRGVAKTTSSIADNEEYQMVLDAMGKTRKQGAIVQEKSSIVNASSTDLLSKMSRLVNNIIDLDHQWAVRKGNFEDKGERMNAIDQFRVDKVYAMMKGAFKSIDSMFGKAEKARKSKSTNIQPLIKTDEKRGMVKLKFLDGFMGKALKNVEQTVNQYMKGHKSNLKKMDNDYKEYYRLYTEIEEVLMKVPDNLEEKMMTLMEGINTEKVDTEQALKDMTERGDQVETTLNNKLTDLGGELRNAFNTLTSIGKKLQQGATEAIKDDTQALEKEGMEATQKMRNDGTRLSQQIGKEKSQSLAALEKNGIAIGKLADEGGLYTRENDMSAERVRKNAVDSLSTVRGGATEQMKVTAEAFISGAVAAETQKKSQLNEAANDLTGKTKGTVLEAMKSIEKNAEPVQLQFDRLLTQQRDIERKTKMNLDGSVKVGEKSIKLETNVESTMKHIKKAIHFADKMVVNDAVESDTSVKNALRSDVDLTKKSGDAMQKQVFDEKTESIDQFSDDIDGYEDTIKKEVAKKTDETASLNTIREQMKNRLITKIDATQERIDETEKVTLPNLEQVAGDFMNQAKSEVDEIPEETSTVIQKTMKIVGTHEDGLEREVKLLIDGMDNSVTPIVKKNIKTLSKMKDDEVDSVQDAEIKIEDNVGDIEADVDKTDDFNKDNQKAADSGKGDISTNFDDAQSALGEAQSKLATNLNTAEARMKTSDGSLEDEIKGMVEEVNTKADQGTAQGEEATLKQMDKANTRVPNAVNSMDGIVERVTSGLYHDTNGLMKTMPTLSGMLKEAQTNRDHFEANSKRQAAAVKSAMSDAKSAQRKGDAEVAEELTKRVSQTQEQTRNEVNAGEAKVESQIAKAEKQVGREADKVEHKQASDQSNLNGEIATMEAKSESELGQVSSSLAAMATSAVSRQKTQAEHDKDLKDKFAGIERESHQRNAEFEKEMGAAGAELAKLVDSDHFEMQELIEKLEQVTDATKTSVENQGHEDKYHLEGLLTKASAETSIVMQKLTVTEDRVNKVLQNLQDVESKANAALAESQRIANTFSGNVGSTARRFVAQLAEEQGKRKSAAAAIVAQTRKNVANIQPLAEIVMKLQTKLTANVQFHLGHVELEEKKIDRSLQEAVMLTEFQDENAIHRVMEKAKDVGVKEDKIRAWKEHAEDKTQDFRNAVVKEFGKLGEEVDLAVLEEAEQKAMEEWAVQSQMAHMKQVLGDEVNDLGKISKQRLAKLAADSGSEIAALMADETLTEEERSKRLAEIKKKAADASRKILEDDGAMKLDAKTAARSLKIATDEVENSADSIGSMGKMTPAAGMQHKLNSVQDLINTAQQEIYSAPVMSSQMEVRASSMVEAAEKESKAEMKQGNGLLSDVAGLLKQLR